MAIVNFPLLDTARSSPSRRSHCLVRRSLVGWSSGRAHNWSALHCSRDLLRFRRNSRRRGGNIARWVETKRGSSSAHWKQPERADPIKSGTLVLWYSGSTRSPRCAVASTGDSLPRRRLLQRGAAGSARLLAQLWKAPSNRAGRPAAAPAANRKLVIVKVRSSRCRLLQRRDANMAAATKREKDQDDVFQCLLIEGAPLVRWKQRTRAKVLAIEGY